MGTLYGFGPIETVDTEKVDALIRLAIGWGEDFDIEFEGSDLNLKSYLENKEAIKKYQREFQEAEEKYIKELEEAERNAVRNAQRGFSDEVILNSIIYNAMSF